MTRQPEPWEPDPRWHPARREAFVAYRDTPERSYAKVAKALRKSTTLLRRWAGEDGWAERMQAWDAERDRVRREEFYEAESDVARSQAEDAAQLRDVLMEPARRLAGRLRRAYELGQDPFAGLTLTQHVRLATQAGRVVEHAVRVERLARGMSTDNVGGADGGPLIPPDVAAKPLEEVEAYLLGRAEERAAREAAEA